MTKEVARFPGPIRGRRMKPKIRVEDSIQVAASQLPPVVGTVQQHTLFFSRMPNV